MQKTWIIGICGILALLGVSCQPKSSEQLLHVQLLDNQLSGQDTVRRRLLAEAATKSDLPADLAGPYLLYAAEHAYETLYYEDALELGRKAFGALSNRSSDDHLSTLYRASSLLCKLHFEHWNYTDSITFYRGLATEFRRQLPESDALDLDLALLGAMEQRVNYRWPEIETLVNKAQVSPAFDTLELADTKAQLYLLQALAIRKQRADVRSAEGRKLLFARTRQAIEQAIQQYRQFDSPRITQALEDFALYQAMLGTDAEFAAACTALDESQNPASPERYGFTTRLKGLRIYNDDKAAALPYYREVYPRIPSFNVTLTDEAHYVLEEVAKQENDHSQLWKIAAAALQNGRCARLENIIPSQLTSQLPKTTVCFNILIDLAVAKVIEYQQTQNEEALDLAERYSDYLLKYWSSDQTGTTDRALLYQFNAFGAEGLDAAIVTAFEQYQKNPGQPNAMALLRRMDATKALLLRRDAAERDKALLLPSHLLQDSLIGVAEQLAVLNTANALAGTGFAAKTADRLATLTETQDDLTQQLNQLGEEDNTGLLLSTALLTAAQLGRENVLSFSWTPSGIFAVAANERAAIAYRINADGIRADIDSLRSLLEEISPNKGEIARYQTLAYRLYRQLVLPAEDILTSGKPLLLLPDGPLSSLPFEALLTEEVMDRSLAAQSPFLLRRHPIRYAPSWAVDQFTSGPGLFAPDESSVAVVAHTSLQAYFQQTHDTLRAQARQYTEHAGAIDRDSLQKLVMGADIVHFSTHAKGNADRLQDNYIFLSRKDSINGSLIESLDLKGKLIVLAACETGIGQQRSGEGAFTLSRSFRLAGASHVVSSLWQVKGKATQELLLEYYRLLFAGHAPAEALWRAKLKLATGKGEVEGYWWPGAWGGVVG